MFAHSPVKDDLLQPNLTARHGNLHGGGYSRRHHSHGKLVKVQGEFVRHQHADEDELFLVIRASSRSSSALARSPSGPGELVAIPKGVEHRPVAREEVHLMLIEPVGICHTGDTISERTVLECARI